MYVTLSVIFVDSGQPCDCQGLTLTCPLIRNKQYYDILLCHYHFMYQTYTFIHVYFRVGSVLTIPASILMDWILKGFILSWQSFLGVAIIIIGFFGLVISEVWKLRKKKVEEEEEIDEEEEETDERTSLLTFAKRDDRSSSIHKRNKFQSRLLHFLI